MRYYVQSAKDVAEKTKYNLKRHVQAEATELDVYLSC